MYFSERKPPLIQSRPYTNLFNMKKLKLLLPTAMLLCLTLSFFSPSANAKGDGPSRKLTHTVKIEYVIRPTGGGYSQGQFEFVEYIDCDSPGGDCYEEVVVEGDPIPSDQ